MLSRTVVLRDGQIFGKRVDVVGTGDVIEASRIECQADTAQRAVLVDGRLIPCEVDHPISSELQVGVAGGVALVVAAGPVELEAVELKHEPVCRPVDIDLVSAGLSGDQGVEAGPRDLWRSLEELFESALQLALLRAGAVGGDRVA